ncbi:multicopper oxidase [Actinophytocola sp.]|uniref:multicopper oxidase family protein n=1 Tax=Actinophytocola sp. TaxID=1872138 RepID=UPI002D7ECCEC|nr:multicopper oxidase [Actinophytocola sp.]HET9138768.1 multicopper oxidase [Actinophytocola sp.]
MLTRRQLMKAGLITGTATLVGPGMIRAGADALPGGTLDPTTLPKYVTPLFILPAMPRAGADSGLDRYNIAVRQFAQQILPAGQPATQVFGYGTPADAGTFHYPAYTIEARVDRPVRVTWTNQLMTPSGSFLPHLLPVDPTLHWANPPGGVAGRDSRPTFTSTPGPYRGPVPFVTHLHGAHVTEESDGYPEAWYLPAARNIPSGFARVGSFYDRYRAEARDRFGVDWSPGSAIFQYRNDQRATALWFHGHELGLTRANIYAGLTGFYLLRGGSGDLPAGVLPGSRREIPLVIQDRSFNADGSLFFPASRDFFGDVPPGGPYLPRTDVPPIWNPEFFGNTIVVNGRTWPALSVEPRRYRFRVLNASNTRVLMLKIVSNPLAARPAQAALPMWVIGADGGFLNSPTRVASLPVAVAERYDVIVDFTGVRPGTQLYLINEGPDEPFGGGAPGTDFEPADPQTTGQVMRFTVGSPSSQDTSTPPDQLDLPDFTTLGRTNRVRRLSLNEMMSEFFDAPVMAMLGTLNDDGTPNPLEWSSPVTENPARGSTEVWELHNFTEDAHPIHVHLVQFEVLGRQPFGGATRPPDTWERGTKDTVIALPQEITRLKARFDIAGRYVWHCHIIDHEDNEMMRPYQVT